MKLFDNVIIRATGQKGTIVDEGTVNGRHYFTVELDNIKNLDDDHFWDGLPNCWEDELKCI